MALWTAARSPAGPACRGQDSPAVEGVHLPMEQLATHQLVLPQGLLAGLALRRPEAEFGGGMIEKSDGPGASPHRGASQRRLAAILAIDVTRYSAMMSEQEEGTYRRVLAEMDRVQREIGRSYGTVFFIAGDGLMAEFPSAVEAVKCALRVQADAARRNPRLPPNQRIEYRIGINAGEIMVRGGRHGGHAINVAARLEALAEPGGILLSGAVFDQAAPLVTANYERLGERTLKNITAPVLVYRLSAETCRAWAGIPALPRAVRRPVAGAGSDLQPDTRASLVVLPLRTMAADGTESYFAEGMIDDIIRVLGGLKELMVISRSSAVTVARSPLDLRRIGHDLDVRYILHGSVHRSGEDLRVAVELSEAEGGMIWADRFDGKLSGLFDLQDRIAMQVLTSVAPQVRERELARARRKHPDSMTAYDLTLQAMERLYQMQREALLDGRRLLRQAVVLDPRHTPAQAYLTWANTQIVGQGWSVNPAADGAEGLAAAAAAVQHDRNDAMALAMYAHSLSFHKGEFERAMVLLDRAVSAGPSCAWAWSNNSFTCQFLGDTVNAVPRAEQGLRLSPVGPDAFWHEHALSQAHYMAGHYAEAAAWGRMSAAHNARQTSNLRTLTASLVALGDLEQARKVASRLMQVVPSFRVAVFQALTPLRGGVRDTFVERLRQAGLPD